MIKEKVEGHDVLVGLVFDEENFYDDEKMKNGVYVEKENEIVLVNNNDDDTEGNVKQTRKRKRLRKEKASKRRR